MLIGPQYISVGKNCYIGSRVQLTAWDSSYIGGTYTPEIILGDGVSIGDESQVTAINRIVIGNGVLTGKKVLITDNSHGEVTREMMDVAPLDRQVVSKGEVVIGDHVWIGEKATIVANVTIGRGSVIAANSVVTKDVPPYCVVAGCPAKIVKNLSNE
jgi:acetyltransferase-like isoleucine patch superfamily enzyme